MVLSVHSVKSNGAFQGKSTTEQAKILNITIIIIGVIIIMIIWSLQHFYLLLCSVFMSQSQLFFSSLSLFD